MTEEEKEEERKKFWEEMRQERPDLFHDDSEYTRRDPDQDLLM